MSTLIVIVNVQGRPCIELAAAANTVHDSWETHHILLHQDPPALVRDEWSSKFHHGIAHDTVAQHGATKQRAVTDFVIWLDSQVTKSAAESILFLSPQDNAAEKDLIQQWQVVSDWM